MRRMRKRKAESQDNERLSKRLSLLNLERNGHRLYVPVESPQLRPASPSALAPIPGDDTMQLDDTKHKVYIYDLEDELSDSGNESDRDGKLVFLPDIEKHLRRNRIPPAVLANRDGELAGMQVVLYREPESLTVAPEHDSVRKVIIEARQRARERQREEQQQRQQQRQQQESTTPTTSAATTTTTTTTHSSSTPISSSPSTAPPPMIAPAFAPSSNGLNGLNGFAHQGWAGAGAPGPAADPDYDPDAMDVD
ncbi:hypothetical protein GGS23DRAFT_594052 [Durotheca rogersii]|uniref:uncharacterized protein n=1 Tax=Durotheca rogersii TaxID=419775 RepID=UPI00221F7030|nr:uncharacterized protein GGS23DRAFT_594052 [Durotheca rogersii]KAI5865887.1 hypothetical protein GGS23DRAFT_594052 [Durotheca rogersii]